MNKPVLDWLPIGARHAATVRRARIREGRAPWSWTLGERLLELSREIEIDEIGAADEVREVSSWLDAGCAGLRQVFEQAAADSDEARRLRIARRSGDAKRLRIAAAELLRAAALCVMESERAGRAARVRAHVGGGWVVWCWNCGRLASRIEDARGQLDAGARTCCAGA